jgi:hypothetical protein
VETILANNYKMPSIKVTIPRELALEKDSNTYQDVQEIIINKEGTTLSKITNNLVEKSATNYNYESDPCLKLEDKHLSSINPEKNNTYIRQNIHKTVTPTKYSKSNSESSLRSSCESSLNKREQQWESAYDSEKVHKAHRVENKAVGSDLASESAPALLSIGLSSDDDNFLATNKSNIRENIVNPINWPDNIRQGYQKIAKGKNRSNSKSPRIKNTLNKSPRTQTSCTQTSCKQTLCTQTSCTQIPCTQTSCTQTACTQIPCTQTSCTQTACTQTSCKQTSCTQSKNNVGESTDYNSVTEIGNFKIFKNNTTTRCINLSENDAKCTNVMAAQKNFSMEKNNYHEKNVFDTWYNCKDFRGCFAVFDRTDAFPYSLLLVSLHGDTVLFTKSAYDKYYVQTVSVLSVIFTDINGNIVTTLLENYYISKHPCAQLFNIKLDSDIIGDLKKIDDIRCSLLSNIPVGIVLKFAEHDTCQQILSNKKTSDTWFKFLDVFDINNVKVKSHLLPITNSSISLFIAPNMTDDEVRRDIGNSFCLIIFDDGDMDINENILNFGSLTFFYILVKPSGMQYELKFYFNYTLRNTWLEDPHLTPEEKIILIMKNVGLTETKLLKHEELKKSIVIQIVNAVDATSQNNPFIKSLIEKPLKFAIRDFFDKNDLPDV